MVLLSCGLAIMFTACRKDDVQIPPDTQVSATTTNKRYNR